MLKFREDSPLNMLFTPVGQLRGNAEVMVSTCAKSNAIAIEPDLKFLDTDCRSQNTKAIGRINARTAYPAGAGGQTKGNESQCKISFRER